jgi:hypothetical protein
LGYSRLWSYAFCWQTWSYSTKSGSSDIFMMDILKKGLHNSNIYQTLGKIEGVAKVAANVHSNVELEVACSRGSA